MSKLLKSSAILGILLILQSCAIIPQNKYLKEQIARPASINEYYNYNKEKPYNSAKESLVIDKKYYEHKLLEMETDYGKVDIDFYKLKEPSEDLIFIFPILGGKSIIEGYFAKYFAEHGYNTAIVHRDKDFKKPEMFDQLENVFKRNVIRDRIAIDYFEKEHGVKNFGSFGISRGAINASITAGVDPRLKYNIFALGGSNLVGVFKNSDVRGVKKYREKVEKYKKITSQEFYNYLESEIFTEPKNFTKYINPDNTMLFLSLFDKAVPLKYGLKFRRELKLPKTVFLASGHYTSILYTQYLKLLPPLDDFCLFPLDFIETVSLDFYDEKFKNKTINYKYIPYMLIQAPVNVVSRVFWYLF
ncbi:MAG: hypothetical protein KBC84_02975 [Proteobacteria bacterium]|nr:hypothetical protein [Pseudomonadota bacterium]